MKAGSSSLIRFSRSAIVLSAFALAACSGDVADLTGSVSAQGSALLHQPNHNPGGNNGGGVTRIAVPTNLTIAVSGDTATLSWNAVAQAIEYQVNIQCAGCGELSQKVATTSATFLGLGNGAYSVKIRAIADNPLNTSQDNSSVWSNGGETFTINVPAPEASAPAPADVTAPIIGAPVIIGTLGLNGWYTSDVSIAWSTSDPESGIASTSGCSVSVTTDIGGQSFTCSATNGAGLTSTSAVTIKRDATAPIIGAPVILGTLGLNGWYTSNVSITWPTSDPVSDIASESGCSVSVTTDIVGQSFICSATNGAGLTSTSATVTVKRDATVPAVSYVGNSDSYTVDQSIAITCSASDATSGVASTTCTNVASDAYLLPLGLNALSATATDNAGNVGSNSTSFTVVVTYAATCNLVKLWVSNAGIANSLCVKLDAAATAEARGNLQAKAGALGAFANQVRAQTGKFIPLDKAPYLLLFASAL